MPDRSDLWSPPVRKWMTEWHSPVAGVLERGRTFRGSSSIHPPSLALESSGTLLLETGGHLLLETGHA